MSAVESATPHEQYRDLPLGERFGIRAKLGLIGMVDIFRRPEEPTLPTSWGIQRVANLLTRHGVEVQLPDAEEPVLGKE